MFIRWKRRFGMKSEKESVKVYAESGVVFHPKSSLVADRKTGVTI